MSDKNSDKSKRETEAHELRRDVRREEAGQRRQQRKDACEARHLEHEEKRETSELIDLSNRLENQEAHSDGPAFDNPTDDALRATVETAESEKILHLGDEVDEQGATIEHNLQREEAEQSGGEASETAAQPETPAPQSAQSERPADAHTHDIPASIARRQQPQVEETIGLFGMHKRNFSSEYHLTRMSKAKRLKQIGKIALEYDALHGLTPVKMRLMFEALGPTFVKVGQILSMRSEILPESFCAELSKLRADADPMPYAIVLGTLENEYQRPIDEIFEHIDTTPLGSASLAQVHRARLVTGEDVAVKVQRPGAQQVMAQDIDIIRSVVRIVSKFVNTDQFVDLHGVVEELWTSFREETNFLAEAKNLNDFYEFHKSVHGVTCPKSYLDLCTEHVVVMDYVDGISIADPERLVAEGYDLEKIGAAIVEDYSTQVLDDGFFHADPHAGNIILKDGIVYFIDLGMVGRMSSHDRGIVKDMIFAVAEGDVPKLKDSLMRFAVTRGDSAELDHSAFLSDLDFIVADFAGLDLKDLDIGEFLTSLLNLARKNDVELPSVVTMFARGMVTLEGLLTEYMPNVNMIQIIQTHIKNEKSTYARVRDMGRDFAASSYRAAKGSLEAAEYLGLASRMLTRGQLKVNTQIMSSDKALRQLGGIIDRMSMAIVIAGLFIGSSVVYYARIEPVVFGIPVIGFMGYVSALVLALMLGRNIWLNSHGGKH